jgi:glycosyltransferase involved in cell wall biosynthesis
MKLSMLLPVLNEGQLLEANLETTLPYVDEAIIVDGGPEGPSTDDTASIVEQFSKVHPGKITYLSDTFDLGDTTWDESKQRNLGLSKVTGDFLMPHCGDMIYDEEDMARLREAVDKYSDKKIFFCFFLEFWLNINHLRLYRAPESFNAWFPVPQIGDIPILSMELELYYENGPCLHFNHSLLTNYDFLYIHKVTRFHYGWITPFEKQVAKHVRNIKQGEWAEHGEQLKAKGEAAIYAWAVNHVLSYEGLDCKYVYTGMQPKQLQDREFSYLDGYEETIVKYEDKFGKNFWLEG